MSSKTPLPPALERDRRIGVLLAALALAVVGQLFFTVWVRAEVLISRDNGYVGRSISCQVLLYDDDRTGPVPDDCAIEEVVRHYPDAVAAEMKAASK